MKKFYFLNTLAYECVVSVEDEVVRCLVENNYEPFPHDAEDGHTSPEAAKSFLCRIEDDSSWEELENLNSIEDLFSEGGYELVASVDEVDVQAFLEEEWEKERVAEQYKIMNLEDEIHNELKSFVPMPDYENVGAVYLSTNSFYLLVTETGEFERYEESSQSALENRLSELRQSPIFGTEVELHNQEYRFEDIARVDINNAQELASLKANLETARQLQDELQGLLDNSGETTVSEPAFEQQM